MTYEYKIPIAPVGKKNSQQILTNRKTGRPFISQSERYKKYERACFAHIISQGVPEVAIDEPVAIIVRFYMPTRRRCDTVNLQEALWDILVNVGVLADDNRDIIAWADAMTFYDKENPRTEVKIMPYFGEYTQWVHKE